MVVPPVPGSQAAWATQDGPWGHTIQHAGQPPRHTSEQSPGVVLGWTRMRGAHAPAKAGPWGHRLLKGGASLPPNVSAVPVGSGKSETCWAVVGVGGVVVVGGSWVARVGVVVAGVGWRLVGAVVDGLEWSEGAWWPNGLEGVCGEDGS